MHSRLLVSGLPRSLPPLPPSPAPPCLPCKVWGPVRVSGHDCERFFLLVVDGYMRYTTVFPLHGKGQVPDVLIHWIRAVCLQLRERFREDLSVLRVHSNRGGEFSSDLLRDFRLGEGILQSFTVPASLQQNGVAERRIGLVMEVARTSLIHVAAPHFLWPFAVRYAAHQLNLWPRSHAFVRDTSADNLSFRTIPCVFLGFPPDAPSWQFYHPTSRRVLPSLNVTFDESSPPPPSPLFLAPGPPPVDPLPPQGPAPSGMSQVDPLPLAVPIKVDVDSGAARGDASGGAEPASAEPGGAEPEGAEPAGADSEGAESGGAEPEGAEPGGTKPEGAELGGAEYEGAESGGCEPKRTAFAEDPAGASPRVSHRRELLSPQQLRKWFAQRAHVRSGVAGAGGPVAGGTGAGGAGASSLGGAGVTARARGTGGAGGARTSDHGAGGTGAGGAGAGGASVGGASAGGAGAGGAGAGGTGAGDPGAVGAGAGGAGAGGPIAGRTLQRRPFFVPPPLSSLPPPDSLQPDSPVPAPSPYAEQTDSLIERREPESRPASPVCAVRTGRRIPSRAASPTVPRLLATVVTDPSFESTSASALVAELVDFAAACRLDYATSLVAESESNCPPSVGAAVLHLVAMLLAPEGDSDPPDIPTPRSYAEANTVPYSSQWKTAMDAEMASRKSTGTYVNAVPPSGPNIVDGMWIFRGVDFFRTFSPTLKMTTLRAPREWHDTLGTMLATLGFAPSTAEPSLFLRTDTSLPPFYVLVYVNDLVFVTADTEAPALVKSELQKRHMCTDLAELHSYLGLQITRDIARRTITLTQSHMVHQVLQRFGFQYSSPQSTPLRTSPLLSAPPSDESVEPSGPYPELVGCLMYLMTCTRHDLAYPLSIVARYVAPGRHRPEHWEAAKRVLRYLSSTSGMGVYNFSLGSGSVSWQSTRSSSVLSSSCEAEIYAGAMAIQELRWLTYLLTDFGERPHFSPVLYVDNKAMLALCQEFRLEHRTKHIVQRYFLARELQQRGQLRLIYMATGQHC
ncbi:unnamed protein product [Closterium sp. NIES-53]